MNDHGDPERRITELEQQLTKRPAHTHLPTTHPYRAMAGRVFEASPPLLEYTWNLKKAKLFGYGYFAVGMVFFAFMLTASLMAQMRHPELHEFAGKVIYPLIPVLMILAVVAFSIRRWRHTRKTFQISVTGDGLTVSRMPGVVFALRDVRVGPWAYGMSMGSALHLRSGRHTFVLGGRDHRRAKNIRCDAPPTPDVDAWLRAADFDQLLSQIGRGHRVATAPPASGQPVMTPGEPTRCLLFANPESISMAPLGKIKRTAESFYAPQAPLLAIDVSADAIRVADPATDAVTASALLPHVRATPETYILLRPWIFEWPMKFFSDAVLRRRRYTAPVMVVHIPGLAPMSVSCRDVASVEVLAAVLDGTYLIQPRFSWRAAPRRINRPADYSVSAADWLTLVQAFGLAANLQDDLDRTQRA